MIRIVIIFLLFIQTSVTVVYSQTTDDSFDPSTRYDQLLESLEQDKSSDKVQAVVPKDEIALLLPNLGSPLYEGWIEGTNPLIWDEERENFLPLSKELLEEFKVKKVIRQTYKKGTNIVQITLYRFENFAGAYSASTVLGSGKPAKLKVGENVFESEESLSFWKGDYYIELRTPNEPDPEVKGFIVLASQEVSDKIKATHQKPVVVVQLPALNRVPGVVKYCLGAICCRKYFPNNVLEIDPAYLEFAQSGGVVTADYKISDNPLEDRTVTLILSRYENKEAAQLVFGEFIDFYKKKEAANKDVKLDIKDRIVKVTNNKDNYTSFKQLGNMFAAVFSVPDKKTGEKILELVPWPIDVTR